MEHKVIRYQPFRRSPGMDLCCKCGERWYIRPERLSYGALLGQVARHFSWPAPPIGAAKAALDAWLNENLPEAHRQAGK
jgi:hypothetical protein